VIRTLFALNGTVSRRDYLVTGITLMAAAGEARIRISLGGGDTLANELEME
jgi:hypothetical protein